MALTVPSWGGDHQLRGRILILADMDHHQFEILAKIGAEADQDDMFKGLGEYLGMTTMKMCQMTLLYVLLVGNPIFPGENEGFLPIMAVANFSDPAETLAQDPERALQLPGIHRENVT